MKKILTLSLIALLALSAFGCTKNKNTQVPPLPEETSTTTEHNETGNDLEDGNIMIIGEIMAFEGKSIHIISGDLIEIFEYDNSNEASFYLGQKVALEKNAAGNILSPYKEEDYSIRHTNMGQIIDQYSGKVLTVNDKMITLETGEGPITVSTYEPSGVQIDDMITAYTISQDELLSAIIILNETQKLELTITAITRDDKGSMILDLIDADKGAYTINASYATVELDIAALEVDDQITVYHNGIMESWPMQVDTILIRP